MASPPLFLYIGGLQMKFEDLELKLVSLVRNRIGQLFEARSPMRVLAEAGLLLKVGQLEVQVNSTGVNWRSTRCWTLPEMWTRRSCMTWWSRR